VLLVLWAAVRPPAVAACTCEFNPHFFELARQADNVIIGRVLKHTRLGESPGLADFPFAMQVKILDVVHGGLKEGEIEIWGGMQSYCMPAIKQFPVGTTWAFVIEPGYEAAPDASGWALPHCSTAWVQVGKGFPSAKSVAKRVRREHVKDGNNEGP
jgi:hypothetical protein